MNIETLKLAITQSEQRYTPEAELRTIRVSDEDKGRTLYGKAIVYDSPSEVMFDSKTGRRFIEVVRPGAVKATLEDFRAEIKLDAGHGRELVIGRRSKGTLRLIDKPDALEIEADLPDNSIGKDIAESVSDDRQDIDGMSFEFRVKPNGERWTKQSNGVWL